MAGTRPNHSSPRVAIQTPLVADEAANEAFDAAFDADASVAGPPAVADAPKSPRAAVRPQSNSAKAASRTGSQAPSPVLPADVPDAAITPIPEPVALLHTKPRFQECLARGLAHRINRLRQIIKGGIGTSGEALVDYAMRAVGKNSLHESKVLHVMRLRNIAAPPRKKAQPAVSIDVVQPIPGATTPPRKIRASPLMRVTGRAKTLAAKKARAEARKKGKGKGTKRNKRMGSPRIPQPLAHEIASAIVQAADQAVVPDVGIAKERNDGPIAWAKRLLSGLGTRVSGATNETVSGATSKIRILTLKLTRTVERIVIGTTTESAPPLPPGIVERRDGWIDAAIERNPVHGRKLRKLWNAAQDRWKTRLAKSVRQYLKHVRARNERKRGSDYDATPLESYGSIKANVPVVDDNGMRTGATVIGIGGAGRPDLMRVLATVNDSQMAFLHAVHAHVLQHWPQDTSTMRGLHHAYRNRPMIHICGGASHTEISDEGAYTHALAQMTMRGIDHRKHPWALIKHTDKTGRVDYHLLIGRANNEGGIWGMNGLYESRLSILGSSILAATAGLDEEALYQVPWNTSAACARADDAFSLNKGPNGQAIHASIYDTNTGESRKIPLIGDKAARRWAAVLDGVILEPRDAILFMKHSKDGLALADPLALVAYASQLPLNGRPLVA